MTALLTTAEVAELLRKSPRFVADEYRRKRLPGSKYGGELHFTQADVDAYIEAHRSVPRVKARRSA